MDLFRYLMTKNGHNYLKDDDLFSYKLAKGQGGTYAIFEGTTINANNTRRGKMKLSLKGNTSQTGTPTPDNPIPVNVVSGDNEVVVCGKNLIPFTNQDFTLNNMHYWVDNGTLYVNGTSSGETSTTSTQYKENFSFTLPAGTYTLSGNSILGAYLKYYDDNTNVFSNPSYTGETGRTFTLNNSTKLYIGFYIYQFSTTNLNTTLMIEKGSSKTDYEPYKSQSYPINLGDIELCKIGDYQDKFIRNSGKNKISQQQRATNLLYFNGATGYDSYVFEAGTYTFSYTDTNSCNVYMQKNGGSPVDLGSSKLINITSDTSFNFWIYRSGLTDGEVNQAMLVEGTYTSETIPPYEPYGDGDWYLKKEIGKVVLDGSETWGNFDAQWYRSNITYANLGITPKMYDSNCLSNYFIYANTEQNIGFNLGSSALYLRIDNTFTNITQFKNWLSTYKPIFHLPLATPTYTKITYQPLIDQLNALQNSRSYDGQTNINQNNNDLASNMEAQILVNE